MTDPELWALLVDVSDRDLCRLLDLLRRWEELSSTVVAYTENGHWIDVDDGNVV